MAAVNSDSVVRRGLPIWYFWLSFVALVEIGVTGYLVARGNDGDFSGQAKGSSRFALFTALWTFVFGTIVGVGTMLRTRFLNTGACHFVYLIITLIFWIAVGASLQVAGNNNSAHHTTIRAAEWLGWIEAIFTLLAIPYVLLGLARAKEGLRGSVAV